MPRRRAHARGREPRAIDPSFGVRLRALRLSRGMTQAELAGRDLTKGFISLLETGRARASLGSVEVLAERLGTRVTDLIGGPATGSQKDRELDLLLAEQAVAAGRAAVALELARRVARRSDGGQRARAQRLEGRALLALARAGDALLPLKKSLATSRALGDLALELQVLYDLATAHGRQGHLGEALGLALECERGVRTGKTRDRAFELKLLTLISGLYASHGDVGSAIAVTERARQLATEIADPLALGQLYAESAFARREQGDLDGALADARRSLEIYEEVGRESMVACAWNNVGWIHIQRGEYERAADAIARAERSARERRDGTVLVLATATRAELNLARGRLADAITLADRVAASPDAATSIRGDALLIRAKALAARKAPLREVRAAFAAALRAIQNEPRLVRAHAHQAFADALAARGDLAGALDQTRRALLASGAGGRQVPPGAQAS